MEKYYYIKLSAANHIVCYDEPLNSESFPIGETWQDYLENKYVPLSNEQVKFRENNPHAGIKEIWDLMLLQPTIEERTLEEAKARKKADIAEYNDSNNINDFTVNNALHSWLTPDERSNYRNSIDAAKILGLEDVSLFVGDMPLTLPTATAEQMLAQIQLYADHCFIVTKRHLLAVDALETIEAVDNYDYTTGYPLKLNFDVEV